MIDIAGSRHPEAKQLLNGPIVRAVRKNRSRLVKEFARKAKWKPIVSNAGIHLGNAYQAPLDSDAVSESMKWIVRGLIFRVTQKRLPANYEIDVRRFLPHQTHDLDEIYGSINLDGPNCIGNCVRVWYAIASDEPFASVWLFEFYGGVYLTVTIDVMPSQ